MSLARILLVASLGIGCLVGAAACDSSKASSTKTGASAASGAAAAAAPSQSFGSGVKLTETTPVATLIANAKSMVGKTVRVEGQVVDVCPKRGCWMDVAGTAPGEKVRFKVTDGEMVFPVDAKGKHAVVEGVVAVNELTLEETKEYVAYQQKEYGAEKDPASVTEPMVIVRIDGTGAQLRDRR
ncbi:MAG TPA: DUF4920 domain-containing protein [Kofleriaceae bacterium]|nr:DUF4920 domain-containing protein [Kofleriaceae bacterium]